MFITDLYFINPGTITTGWRRKISQITFYYFWTGTIQKVVPIEKESMVLYYSKYGLAIRDPISGKILSRIQIPELK